MIASGAVKKPAAQGTKGRPMGCDPIQTIPAQNPLAGILEKTRANFAEGRKKNKLGRPAELAEDFRRGQGQAVSDSAFS